MTEVPREFSLPEDAFERQRSILGAHVVAPRPSRRTIRSRVLTVTTVLAVGGVLVMLGLGLGGRLLDLIRGGGPVVPEVQAPTVSPDGRTVAFWVGEREHRGAAYVVNADGSRQRKLTPAGAASVRTSGSRMRAAMPAPSAAAALAWLSRRRAKRC